MSAFFLTMIFMLFECCDIALNPQNSFAELVNSYIQRYKKSPILFFATQFNFLFLSFCIFYLNKTALFVLYAFYILDLLTKLVFIKNSLDVKNDAKFDEILNSNLQISKKIRICVSLACAATFFVLVF